MDISLKHFGITVEFQLDDQKFYINPHEEHEDRRPEDGDFILSFMRAGLTELNINSELQRHLKGLRCYGFEDTSYLLDDQLRQYWRTSESESAGSSPNPGKGIQSVNETLMELGEMMFGTEALRHEDQTYGIAMNFDDVRFNYFHVDDNFIDPYMEETATCEILVVDSWKKHEQTVRKMIFEKKSDYFYLVCEELRKNELNALVNFLPDNIAKKVICKKSKWKMPLG